MQHYLKISLALVSTKTAHGIANSVRRKASLVSFIVLYHASKKTLVWPQDTSKQNSIVLSEHKLLTQEQYPHFVSFTNRIGPHGIIVEYTGIYREPAEHGAIYTSTEACRERRHWSKTTPETKNNILFLHLNWKKRRRTRCATRWSAASAASSPGTAAASTSRPCTKGSRRGSTAAASHGQASTPRQKDLHPLPKKVRRLAEFLSSPIS